GEAKAINNIGLAYFYHSQIDTAIVYYARALQVARLAHDSDNMASGYNSLGNAYKALSNLPLAGEYFRHALETWEALHDSSGISLVYLNLGSLYNKMGNYTLATEFYLKCIEIQKKQNDLSNLARAMNGLGTCYLTQKNYDKAIEYFTQAIELFKKIDDKAGYVITTINVGNCYFYQGRYATARTFYERGLKLRLQMRNENGMAECFTDIGTAYMKEGDYGNAEDYLNKAYAIFSKTGTDNELSMLTMNMSELYSKTNRTGKAKEYLARGMDYVRKTGSASEIMNSLIDAANIYSNLGDYKNAWAMEHRYIQMRDSLFNLSTAQTITQMQSAFDLRNKENELELTNRKVELQGEKINKQQWLLYLLTLASLLFVLLVFFIYRGYKRSRSANQELKKAYHIIEEKNKAITDSLDYAQKIQQAILPLTRDLANVFPAGFGLYGPKDVVSGDFYWFAELDEKFLLAAADCTGHGVPGAFMSMLGSDKLTHAVREKNLTRPGEILSYLNRSVKHTLKQNESDSELRDGMDIALCCFDFKGKKMEFAGANRPLFHVRKGKLTEYRPTKASIGGFTGDEQAYENHVIDIEKDDMVYIFTDGYADQFGGPEGKKFMTKNLKELIVEVSVHHPREQEKIFVDHFKKWKGDREQVDDLLLIGVRI
ncbi:MAG TPA: tetratricopeptide repeat protein, partial [Bacteroidia bacterium]